MFWPCCVEFWVGYQTNFVFSDKFKEFYKLIVRLSDILQPLLDLAFLSSWYFSTSCHPSVTKVSAYHINVILVSFKSYWSFTLWSTYSFIIALANMTSIDYFSMVNYISKSDKRSINLKAFLHLPISMGIFLSVTQACYCYELYPFSVNIERLHEECIKHHIRICYFMYFCFSKLK